MRGREEREEGKKRGEGMRGGRAWREDGGMEEGGWREAGKSLMNSSKGAPGFFFFNKQQAVKLLSDQSL